MPLSLPEAASSGDPPPPGKNDQLMTELLQNTAKGKLIRKKKQQKLKESFTQRNFQKYLLSQCVCDAHLKKHVHEPPKWHREFDQLELAYAQCCESCCLRPCMMNGKKLEFIESLKVDHEDPVFAINNAKMHALILFNKYCGKLFMKRMKMSSGPPLCVPVCVTAALPQLLAQAVAELEDKLKEDHELVSLSGDSQH